MKKKLLKKKVKAKHEKSKKLEQDYLNIINSKNKLIDQSLDNGLLREEITNHLIKGK